VVLYLFRQLVSDPFFEKIRGEITLIHSWKVKRRRIPASAIFSTKLASSIVSPASASDSLMPNIDTQPPKQKHLSFSH
jgi:hypothetical protein